ncbi:MAG TPA: hypothetical protein VGH13_23280 [Xanthobacteraceae bacterium]|jgi:hypothetical protein
MNLAWLTWSNPVALWWIFLATVSAVNVVLWFKLCAFAVRTATNRPPGLFGIEPLVLLSGAYVFGCAFRSILPRADVQRICLFDTWLSSVMVGRSVATVAELCFAIQWAIVLRELGQLTHSDTAKNIAKLIVPLIALAEYCSWYAVISTDFLGNVLENSLWTVTFTLIAIALARVALSFRGIAQWIIAATAAGAIGYVIFMSAVDVPMYFARWQAELADGTLPLGLLAGLYDVAAHWVVTYDITRWQHEILWMSLYFSAAVWVSLLLGGFPLVKNQLPSYRIRRPLLRAARRPLVIS